MRILMILLLILAVGITGCRSDSTTATPLRECEVVSFASLHGRALFLVEGWEPVAVSVVGSTVEEVKCKLGPPQPVGDAPPDDDGGFYLMYEAVDGLYRVHYSADWSKVAKAFKAKLKPEETSEQPAAQVQSEGAPSD